MKIAICSDSHDNLTNISKFLFYCNNNDVEKIIHCGDWCAPSILKFFRKNFAEQICGVYGNVHADDETMQKFAKDLNIKLQANKLETEIELNKNKILKCYVTHYPDVAKEKAELNKYDFIFYGHNHRPWIEKINKTYLVNPGTLAGMFNRATFAIYNTKTKKMELLLLDQI